MANKMLYPVDSLKRQVIDLSGMWKFCFDYDGSGEKKGYFNGLKDYTNMPVPAAFNDFFTDKSSREYVGDFWYEKEFYAESSWKNLDVDIRFFGAVHKAEIYFNGKKMIYHNGGFTPFTINVNDLLYYDKPNKIVCKLNNELDQTTLPVGETKVLPNGHKTAKPYFDFFNYSGLIRPVKIVVTPRESIMDISLSHNIINSDTETKYIVETNGEHSVLLSVYDEDGNLVSTQEGKENIIKINKTKLWKPLNSYLYRFIFNIINGKDIIDEYYLDVGIRTVNVKGNRILINNEPVYLKGFGKHEECEINGRGFNLAVIKRDFECMKWIGANSFRTAHYPYSEEIYQLADREGFMVIDEVAAVGMMKSLMNALDAANANKKTEGYFEQPIVHDVTINNHLDAVKEYMIRDKNYACVIMWSLLNEPDTLDDKAVPYFEKIFNKCLELDLQKRPRTFALLMSSLPGKCKCSYLCDVIMLNRYYGWYLNGGYELDIAMDNLDKELELWDKVNKPVMFSEYGCDTFAGIHKLPSVMWSEEYYVEYLEKTHEIFDKHNCVMGEQPWNFADFQTTEGIIRADGNKKGIFTRNRQPKMAAHYLKKRWNSLPLNYKNN